MPFDFHDLTEQLERFSSPRVALRPLALCDAWPLFQASRNDLFNAHLLWEKPESPAEVLHRVSLIRDEARRGRMTALSAVSRDTGEWVSLFRFQPLREDHSTVEVGIWTHPSFWAGRISFELGHLCMDTSFRISSVNRLVAVVDEGNKASRNLMRAFGATMRRPIQRLSETGRLLNMLEFELTRAEWLVKRKQNSDFYEHGAIPEREELAA